MHRYRSIYREKVLSPLTPEGECREIIMPTLDPSLQLAIQRSETTRSLKLCLTLLSMNA
jgi:hypothetical protein